MADNKSRVNLWMANRQYDELKMLAGFEGRSVSDIIRQLVNEFLKDNQELIEKNGGEDVV